MARLPKKRWEALSRAIVLDPEISCLGNTSQVLDVANNLALLGDSDEEVLAALRDLFPRKATVTT